jgi:integrase
MRQLCIRLIAVGEPAAQKSLIALNLGQGFGALQPSSYRSTERHLLRYAKPLHGLGLALVTRRDIGSLLAGLATTSGNASANRTRASLSALFRWAMERGLVEQNPTIGTHIAPETPRSRVLPLEELAAVWRASGDDAYGAIVKLLILTACRGAEIGGLRFDEIHDDAGRSRPSNGLGQPAQVGRRFCTWPFATNSTRSTGFISHQLSGYCGNGLTIRIIFGDAPACEVRP